MSAKVHDSPRYDVWCAVRLVSRAAAQRGSHCWKGAAPAGIDICGVFRIVPGGRLPSATMSEGSETRLVSPSPIFHSPKAIVWLVPSMMPAIETTAPYWNTPLGGPPVIVERNSRLEP